MAHSDDPPQPPEPKQPESAAHTLAGKAARQARLAEEMRKNLQKRKAQQRARHARAKSD